MDRLDKECDFRGLIIRIAEELNKDDIKKLKYYLMGKVPRKKLDEADDGIEVLSVMEDAGLFSERDPSKLRDAFQDIKVNILAKELDEYISMKTYPSVASNSLNTDSCPASLEKSADTIHNRTSKLKFEGPCNITDDMLVRHFKETQTFQELQGMMDTETVVVISGLLGSGKSQLATKYGLTFRQQNLGMSSLSWKIHAKDKSSFRKSVHLLAEKLHIEVQKQPEDYALHELVKDYFESINNEIQKSGTNVHLLIIDDVGKECEDLVERVTHLLCINQSWRILVTTINELFLEDKKHLFNKGFNKTEAVEFLSDQQDISQIPESETKAYHSLAKKMSYLPLGLNGARTYMRKARLSPKKFERYITEEKLQMIDKKLEEKSIEEKNRSLFGALQIFIDILQKDLDVDAFEMFQMTQFLETDNIPIILFEGLPENSYSDYDNSLSTNALVEAVQKFSFGTVHGIDDERLLSTHSAVSLTLQAFTAAKEKRKLLKKLLQVLASLMDKDNGQPSDYQRIVSLLPHANLALQHADKIPEIDNDLEVRLLKIYLHDVVGYTFNYETNMEMQKFHSDAAMRDCYELVGKENFAICLDAEKDNAFDEMDASSLNKLAETKATTIIELMSKFVNENKGTILKAATHFILNKRRSIDDLQFLSRKLKKDPMSEYKLSETEYFKLCKQRLAIPLDEVKESFVLELILGVFYTFGRRLYYIRKDSELSLRRRFYIALFVAAKMAEHLRQNFKNSQPLYSMLALRNGSLELYFEDLPELDLRTNANLLSTAEQYHQLLVDENIFYVFGVYKMSAFEDDFHKAICYKQLLRCYGTMIDMENDISKRHDLEKRGYKVAKDLLEKCKDERISGRTRQSESFMIRTADFFMRLNRTEDAEQLYMEVCPEDIKDPCQKIEIRMLSKHELNAIYGLKNCYTKKGKITEAIHLLQRLSGKLPKEQKIEHDDIQKLLAELQRS